MIRTEGLTKRYGGVTAVDGLCLDLPAGSVVGVVGPNGAGKTTLLRLLLGITRPSAGRGSVLGHPLADSLAIRRAVALVPDSKALYQHTTVAGFLRFYAAFHPSVDGGAARELLGRWDVDLDRPTAKLSRGERSKVLLAAVVARGAPLTLLDEPS
ncbi:MAG: ATP-binding cassette domain-containing protein, partial [Gemmatimonadales bacterium]